MRPDRTALVTGATGFIGGRLANALAEDGWQVRGLVRDRGRAGELAERGIELVEGDVLDASRCAARATASRSPTTSCTDGTGWRGDFEESERAAARNFAEMAKREGVERVVYLGGLGDQPRSKHLRSRRRPPRSCDSTAPRSPISGRRWWWERVASPTGRSATWSSGCRR